MEAGNFRLFCCDASSRWDQTLALMENLPKPEDIPQYNNSIYFVLNDNEVTIINDYKDPKISQPEPNLTLGNKIKKARKKTKYRLSELSCPDCGKTFEYPQHMALHFQQSTDLKRCCPMCGEIMYRDELIKHLEKEHKKKPYPCQKCPFIALSLSQHSEHLAKTHGPSSHSCGDCGRSFQSMYALSAHMGVHAVKTCPGCDKMFRNQMCYRYHVKQCCNLDTTREDTHRTKNKVTVEVKNAKSNKKIKVGLRGSSNNECFCDYCGKRFSGKKFVAAHIQIVHLKNTHRPCPYCGKFLASAHMTEHIKKHEQTVSFTCERCGLILRSRLGYVQHLRLHTGEMPYACKYCGETFSASSRRSEHIRKVHKASEIVLKQECKFCPARFRLPYALRKHLLTAHSDKSEEHEPQFECTICQEKFGSCRGLVHHSRKHQQFPMKVYNKSKRHCESLDDIGSESVDIY